MFERVFIWMTWMLEDCSCVEEFSFKRQLSFFHLGNSKFCGDVWLECGFLKSIIVYNYNPPQKIIILIIIILRRRGGGRRKGIGISLHFFSIYWGSWNSDSDGGFDFFKVGRLDVIFYEWVLKLKVWRGQSWAVF